nr:MAG TPA: hypothetical protein [Bacteriophage sp.]
MAFATPSTYNYFTLTSLRHARLIITISILQYHIYIRNIERSVNDNQRILPLTLCIQKFTH